jgi:hypothetical protein
MATDRHPHRSFGGLVVGRRRAHFPAASRHMGGQLGRTHVRQSALPHPR